MNGIESYLKNVVYSLVAQSVYANTDEFYFTISTDYPYFGIYQGVYEPDEFYDIRNHSIPIYVPYLTGTAFEYIAASINIVVRSIDVNTTSKYGFDDCISWKFYYINGWTRGQFDGDKNTAEGIAVSASWCYHTNASTIIPIEITAKGKIRYKTTVTIDGESITIHHTTNEPEINEEIKVIPN